MYLKAACCFAMGMHPADPIAGIFGPAKHWGKAQIPAGKTESFHSLIFWSEYLCEKRLAFGLRPAIHAELRSRVGKLYNEWWVGMRYHVVAVNRNEMFEIYANTEWIRDNFNELRS